MHLEDTHAGKDFLGSRRHGFSRLEGEINDWLSVNDGAVEIVDRRLAVSGVDDGKGEGVYQQVAVAIWYNEIGKRGAADYAPMTG